MAKPNLKNMIADKGERIALLAAGGIMLLLMLVGLLSLTDAPDTQKYIKDVEQGAATVKSAMGAKSGAITALPPEVLTKSIAQKEFLATGTRHLFFDPIAPPDDRAINPIVLAVADIQATYVPAKVITYDIDERDGKLFVGVLSHNPAKGEKVDKDQATMFLNELKKRNGFKPPPKRNAPPNGGEGPNGGGLFLKGGGPGGGVGAPIETGPRLDVEYIPFDPELLVGKRPAWTIYPQRMIVVYAEFPYKKQIQEIQKALRLKNEDEVFNIDKGLDTPYFRGFVIQRQVAFSDGKIESSWRDLDFDGHYRSTIFPRKFGDIEEDPGNQLVMLHEDHELWMPLPILKSGKYPDIKLEGITNSIAAIKNLNKPPEQPKAPSTLRGEGNIFKPTKSSGTGAIGQPNGEGILIPKKGVSGEGKAGGGEGNTGGKKFADQPEFVLLRILDNDISPDRLYSYRIKVRMQNPNWVGKKDPKTNEAEKKEKYTFVSRPNDADVEMIEGPWTEMKGTERVPREEYLFAVDPAIDPKDAKKTTISLKAGQGVLQFQRWLPVATVGNYKEPVADWVVADVVATRGTYLGGKQFVNLPIWSSKSNNFVLRELPAEKGVKAKEPRRGVIMDPTKPGPSFLVVDVEGGGPRETRFLAKTITEETAAEILLLDEEGKLHAFSSVLDRPDKGRAAREKRWRDWIDATEQNLPDPNGTGTTVPKKKDFMD